MPLSDVEMLQNLYQGVAMGRTGILDVLPETTDDKFRSALTQQLTEYDKIAESARRLLEQRGQTAEEPGAMVKLSSRVMAGMKTLTDHSPAKIAELMIQGNTMGVTQGIKDLHDYGQGDQKVRDLANKLLKTEQANIEQMKKFL